MAFGGNSSSFTLPHTHNQTLANDGGTLSQALTDMGAVTLFSLISGAVDPQTAINTGNIATNTGNIATNTGNISTNTANISTNTGNISTNAGNISTNTGNITTNATAIAGLTADNGKWSAVNATTFRNSVIVGAQAGTIEEI